MRKSIYVLMIIIFTVLIYLGWLWVKNVPSTPVQFNGKKEKKKENHINEHHDSKTIKIALIESKTGIPAGVEGKISDIVEFAVDRINMEGGLLNTNIELLAFDDEFTALGAQHAAQKAVEANVSAVIGGFFSSTAIESAKILQKAKIPFIVTGASNPQVTKIGDYIFRMNYIDSFQGAAMAEFAYNDLKARSAILMANAGNVYSPYLVDVFEEQFRQWGGQIIYKGEYLADSESFLSAAKEINQHKADVIFLPGYEKDSAEIVREVRKMGNKTIFIGADGWLPTMISFGGDSVKDNYYAKLWHSDAKLTTGHFEVLRAWEEKFGKIKNDKEVLSLDACYLLFEAIKRAGTQEPENIYNALRSTKDYHGIAGDYDFRNSGDSRRPLMVLKLTGENPELIKKIEPKSIKIAAIFAKTGDAAGVNIMAYESARYAVDEINNKGGILGNLFNLVEYDNKSTVLGSIEVAEQAVRDGVSVVIGASWSSQTSAMAPIFQKNKILMLSPASTNPKFTGMGDYIFRICFTDKMQGEVMAAFSQTDLKAQTAVVLTNTNSEYSVDLAKFFIDKFNQNGKVLKEIDYLQNTTNFIPILEETKALNPDVIFIPGYPRDVTYIVKQARQIGIQQTLLGGDGWNEMMSANAKEELEGCYFSEHWHIDIPDIKSREFVNKYKKTHELYKTGLVALTYDSFNIIADVIKKTKSTDVQKIKDELAGTKKYHGITGEITFDANGDPIKPVVILKFVNGNADFFKSYILSENY